MSTTTVQPTTRIEVADKAPLPYGLLSVAEVIPSTRHLPFEYDAVCGHGTGVAPDICNYSGDPEDWDPNKDDTYSLADATSVPVVLYAKTTCRLVGRDRANLETLATKVLNLGEDRALTTALIDLATDDAETVTAPGPLGELTNDLAKGTLARAENIARSYPGGGVILMPTPMAVLAGLTISGTNLQTPLGTKVAVYEVDPEAQEWETFVFSRVVITRGVAELAPGMHVKTASNEYTVMAERPYAVGYDCTPTRITAGGA